MNPSQKNARYERIFDQLTTLLDASSFVPSRMSTAIALLHHKMGYFSWTGFYLLRQGELMVGPYQGPLACQRLERPRGVCWAACLQAKTLVVPDVHAFEGHIACDPRSQSEIVVPVFNLAGMITGVLDVDSTHHSAFDETDARWLEKILNLIGPVENPDLWT